MRIFSIMALVALAACNGGDCDNTECDGGNTDSCTNCDTDTGTDPTATGGFTAPKVALPDGTLEDCVSNLDEAFSVPSGETKTEIPVGDYDLTFGSLDLATEYSDWLGVHTSVDGSQWIAPSDVASIAKDTTLAPEPPAVSRYIGGQTWTCNDAGSTDESTAQSILVSYIDEIDGLQIDLGIGTPEIEGDDLFHQDEECTDTGRFINNTQIQFIIDCSFQYIETECWHGELADRPAAWAW